ncbi:MAG: hypothetical protein PHU23_09885 [Dehalococcoidales bacterium]|nr:hypothetical protein [Dehalococcoidales bacterium]
MDKLINAYQGSSATTWSGFLKEIGLNISAGDYYYKSIDMPIIYISDEYYLSAYQIFSDESSKSYMWGVPIGYGFSLREAPDPVAYPTRHDVAEALRTSVNGIDTLGFAVSHVPPEYLATAAGVVGATGWGGCHYCVGCNCDIESRTMLVKRPC